MAGEMAQWVRAPGCSSEGPEFKSQQPHGGSHTKIYEIVPKAVFKGICTAINTYIKNKIVKSKAWPSSTSEC